MNEDKQKSTSFKLDENLIDGITRNLKGKQSVSNFCLEATIEKVNRMDSKNKELRLNQLKKDREFLKPIIEEIIKDMNG